MVKVPKGYRSRNVQDRRGSRRSARRSSSSGGISSGGSLGGLGGALGGGALSGAAAPRSGRRGCGGIGLILVVVVGILLFSFLGNGGGLASPDLANDAGSAAGVSQTNVDSSSFSANENSAFDLANAVLDDVQDFWTGEFAASDSVYPEAGLVIFDNAVSTGGCGQASSNVGPFYCPADSNAYIDLQFMFTLQSQLGAEGDFAQAYILAHEIGHHVQNVVGVNGRVRQAQSGVSQADANQLNVFLELQADCLAGMWARDFQIRTDEILASGDQDLINNSLLLEDGDLNEGVVAAGAVGDDAITGSTNAENFTHGTSAQRVEWFSRGFDTGDFEQCWTFPEGSI